MAMVAVYKCGCERIVYHKAKTVCRDHRASEVRRYSEIAVEEAEAKVKATEAAAKKDALPESLGPRITVIMGRVISYDDANLDNLEWPQVFSCRPMIGDIIQSMSGFNVYVIGVTHTIGPGGVPYLQIIVDVNPKRHVTLSRQGEAL